MDDTIKTGSYKVKTICLDSWGGKSMKMLEKKGNSKNKKVVNDIFEKCSTLTNDEYWISVFKNCSIDKFPRGYSYKNSMLIYRKGNTIDRMLVPDNPSEAFSACKTFFKKSSGLMSMGDRRKLKKEQDEKYAKLPKVKDKKWKDIKSDKNKDILMAEYASHLCRKHKYDDGKRNNLLTVLRIGLILKVFNANTIHMESGKITAIEGLVYDKYEDKYYVDPKCIKTKTSRRKTSSSKKKKPKVQFLNNWEKYLKNLEKNSKDKYNFHVINRTLSESFETVSDSLNTTDSI